MYAAVTFILYLSDATVQKYIADIYMGFWIPGVKCLKRAEMLKTEK